MNSFVAFAIFFFSAFAMGTFNRKYDIFLGGHALSDSVQDIYKIVSMAIFGLIIAVTVFVLIKLKDIKVLYMYFCGALLGFGLMVGGLCRPMRMLGCFAFTSDYWQPGVLIVFGFVFLLNFFGFKMFLNGRYGPEDSKIGIKSIIGSILFGAGWGMTGLGPGAAIINFFIMPWMAIFVVCMVAGALLNDWNEGKLKNAYVEME